MGWIIFSSIGLGMSLIMLFVDFIGSGYVKKGHFSWATLLTFGSSLSFLLFKTSHFWAGRITGRLNS
jgi:hypothetical protein